MEILYSGISTVILKLSPHSHLICLQNLREILEDIPGSVLGG